jgi:hypothetical protein
VTLDAEFHPGGVCAHRHHALTPSRGGLPLVQVKTPSIGALALGLVPFAAMCFSVALWDRIEPMIFGLPFNLFWLILWIALTPCCMWGAYRLESTADRAANHDS